MKKSIIIIGAGLSGLSLAYFLRDQNFDITIVEARNRIGGRIFTKRTLVGSPVEMGATWLTPAHHNLLELIEELRIKFIPQYYGKTVHYQYEGGQQRVPVPSNLPESFRFNDGTDEIVKRLADALKDNVAIYYNQPVVSLNFSEKAVVTTQNGRYEGDVVVSTLPPNLLASTITFEPELPQNLKKAMVNTQTWMGDSIKIAAVYDDKPWIQDGNGSFFSTSGPIVEFYEHSRNALHEGVLMGFSNQTDERRITTQLNDFLPGKTAQQILLKNWAEEKFTYHPNPDPVMPHQGQGHPIFHRTYFDAKLFLAGTETSDYHPGYMEGAVVSAKRTKDQLLRYDEMVNN